MEDLRGDEGLVVIPGGMGGGKSETSIRIRHRLVHTDGLSALVVQPDGSTRTGIDSEGEAGSRSGLRTETVRIPSDNPYIAVHIARERSVDIVVFLDSHMFSPYPLIGSVFANRKDGRTVLVDTLTFDYGGEEYLAARVLSARADIIFPPRYNRCLCQRKKGKPKGKFSQLLIKTPYSKREELLALLTGSENIEMRILVENGTRDPKTGLILPAYAGPRNITGDVSKSIVIPEGVSTGVDYLARCSRCYVRPRRLDVF